MAKQHTVKQGEHISRIAHQYGFSDYRTVWNYAENASLKKKRKNPNVLYPGDKVYIPDKELKTEACNTGQLHRFVVPAQTLKLRLIIKGFDERPIVNTPCVLKVGSKTYSMTTSSTGLIEQRILKTAETASLFIRDLEIPLLIGHLDPVEEFSGQQARLNNLGYNAGTSADPEDLQFKSAVEEFQCDYHLTIDGICGSSTQAKLKEVHSS